MAGLRYYPHPTQSGVYGQYPWYAEGAEKYKTKVYTTDTDVCERCKKENPALTQSNRYLENGTCRSCLTRDARNSHFDHLNGIRKWTEHYEYPGTPEAAMRLGLDWYYNGERCKSFGAHFMKKRMSNGKCVECARLRKESANTPRIEARKNGHTYYTPTKHCTKCDSLAPRRVNDDMCSGCAPVTPHNPARIEARKNGSTYYTPSTPCDDCGTLAPRRTQDNRCSGCAPITPHDPARAAARQTGATWYNPTNPCPHCDTLSPRRTQDNRCSGCAPAVPTGLDPASRELMEQALDLVISKQDALAMGLKVYRTGKPCKNDHTGYRYVSTGNCIQCHRER